MPTIGNQSRWRTEPQWIRVFMFLLKPDVVHQCQINQASFAYPPTSFTWDNTLAGDRTDVVPGMTMLLGNTAGSDDLGRNRIKGVPTSTLYAPAAVSQGVSDGELYYKDNAYVTVLNDFRVWAKHPRYNGTDAFKDWDTGFLPPQPQANAGGGYAAMVDPDTGLIDVGFNGTQSFGTGLGMVITAYSWDFADGTAGSSTGVGVVPSVTFPAGFRYISLLVTDSDGNTHRAYRPVYAGEAGDPQLITQFQILSHKQKWGGGQEMSVRIDQDISPSDFPDGTLMMMWYECGWGDGNRGPINVSKGPAGREHMMFVGWHDDGDHQIVAGPRGIRRGTVLNFVDVAGRLSKLPGFTQTIERATTATTWWQMENLHLDNYIHSILANQSTALEVVDYHQANSSYNLSTLGSDGESLYDQADKRAKPMACRLNADREGNLWTVPDPILLPTQQQYDDEGILPFQRTDEVMCDIAETDWSEIKYKWMRSPRVHWHKGYAIKSSSTPAASVSQIPVIIGKAPGPVPGQGLGDSEENEQVAITELEYLYRLGNMYANRLNATQGTFEIDLIHGNEAGIDTAYGEWVTLTVSPESAAQRGLNFEEARFLPLEISHTYNHRNWSRKTTLVAEKETSGFPATVIPQDNNTLPTYEEQPVGSYDPVFHSVESGYGDADSFVPSRLMLFETIAGTLWRGTGNVLAPTWNSFAMPSGIQSALRVSSGTPSDINDANQTVVDAAQDLFDANVVYVLGPGGVAKLENPMSGTPVWTDMGVTPASSHNWGYYGGYAGIFHFGQLHPQVNVQGYFGWLEYPNSPGGGNIYYCYTTDYFATINRTDTGLAFTGGHAGSLSLDCFASGVGNMRVVCMEHIYNVFSTDGGATFDSPHTQASGYTKFEGGIWKYGYSHFGGGEARDQDSLGWIVGKENSAPYRNMFVGDALAMSVSSPLTQCAISSRTLAILTVDSNHQTAVVDTAVYRTEDGWNTFAVEATALPDKPHCINGWPTNPMFAVVCASSYLMVTVDGWDNQVDITPSAGGATLEVCFADFSEVYDPGGVHPAV